MEKVLISIVTYNSKDVFTTLDSLRPIVTENDHIDLVIYDNGSESAYLARLEKYDFIKVIASGSNDGFGHGHNQTLLQADYKYALICNPDVIVEVGVIETLLESFNDDPAIAVVVPKVLNEDGSTQYLVRKKLDVFDYFLRFTSISFINRRFEKRLATFECRDLADDKKSFIKMASGCFMLVDVERYKEIQGFDERFFMYFEDNDLCLRFEKAGYKILYTPFTTVVHLYGKGAHRSWKLFKIFIQSMFKFFNKWGWRFF